MSERLVRETNPAPPVQSPERIKLGRILHLDRSLSRSSRAWWEAHVIVHGLFGLLVTLCALCLSDEPDNSVYGFLLVVFGLTWIVTTFLMELLIRRNAAYELQLLPFGIRQTTLKGTVELIEPEVVGGKWLRWSKEITLRQGQKKTTILLSQFMHRHERAAIIEHCSQFLSPEQQAAFGLEWTRAFYELITPPKPSLHRLLVTCVAAYGPVCVMGVAIIEGILIAYPDAVTVNGTSLRWTYPPLIIVPLVFTGPLAAAYFFERSARDKDAKQPLWDHEAH